MTKGILEKDSKLREIFPDGFVLLKSPIKDRGTGREGEIIEAYEVDLDQISEDQMGLVIDKFKEMGLEATEEALREEGYRIQAKHFKAIAFDLAQII